MITEKAGLDISQLRASIPALADCVYLNTGTFGPSPTSVMAKIRVVLELIEKQGPYSPVVRQSVEKDGFEAVRKKAAAFLRVSADELALVRNVSDGINTIAYGLDWRPGDEVVISDQEHQSGLLPWMILAKRTGIRVRTAALSDNPDEILQNFEDQITSKTRIVFASHVTHRGLLLPARQLVDLAHENGALMVFDGAHAVGQIPVYPQRIGCDAYLASGHKWLLGPQGTGMAYVPQKHLETFQPSWSGWGAQQDEYLDNPHAPLAMKDSARRYEFGTKHWSLYPGLGASIEFIGSIGVDGIRERVTPLAERLKHHIKQFPTLLLLTPLEEAMSTGLVSVRLPETTPKNLKDQLWDKHRMLVSYDYPHRVLRFSVAFFTTEEEVELAMDAIRELAAA